ncbi:MAG TPA: squalene synthase HpnC [Ignavibacteriaceae bacterium]|nr:squalene synthase HpnC [Ignavibacteriaceae bacterium]
MNDSVYDNALKFAREHYENFPVVSFLIRRDLQKHVAIIYWFARTADDIADEGNLAAGDRMARLNGFESSFRRLLQGKYDSGYDEALHLTLEKKKLNPEHFINLLKAFKQDVIKKEYADYKQLLDYCKISANPVGRLILELHSIREEEAFRYSDNICTALQITNFLQDVNIDFQKGRIYLPQNELAKFGISKIMFEEKEINLKFKQLIEFNINRTQLLFDEGRKLLKFLQGRLKYEIKWTILGGEAILQKIRNNDFNVFIRPELTKKDFIKLLIRSFK